jgi:hypothetical protein
MRVRLLLILAVVAFSARIAHGKPVSVRVVSATETCDGPNASAAAAGSTLPNLRASAARVAVGPRQKLIVSFFDDNGNPTAARNRGFTQVTVTAAGAPIAKLTLASQQALADETCMEVTTDDQPSLTGLATVPENTLIQVDVEGDKLNAADKTFFARRARIAVEPISRVVGYKSQCPANLNRVDFINSPTDLFDRGARLSHRENVLIAFFDGSGQPVTVREMELREVALAVRVSTPDGRASYKRIYTRTFSDLADYEKNSGCLSLPGPNHPGVFDIRYYPDNSDVRVEVVYESGKTVTAQGLTRNSWHVDDGILIGNYFSVTARWGLLGFHPVPTETGVRLAPTPVVITGGSRKYLTSEIDIGMYIAASAVVEKTKEGSDSAKDFTAVGVGGLFDVTGIVYLGATYTFSAVRSNPNPGLSVLVGLGPKAVSWLAGQSKKEK